MGSIMLSAHLVLARTLAILFLVAASLPTLLGAQSLSEESCYHGSLSRPFLWATSGVEARGQATCWVVDSLQDDILMLSPDGWMENGLDRQTTEIRRPRQIRSADSGYLVMQLSSESLPEIRKVDDELNIIGNPLTLDQKRVRAIYDYIPFEEGIFFFGDVFMGDLLDPEAATGFFYSDADGSLIEISKLESPSADVVFNYTTDDSIRFMASLDGVPYLLFLDPRPSIGRINPRTLEIERLPDFPEDFRHFPLVRFTNQWKDAAAALKPAKPYLKAYLQVLEETPRMAAGIYVDADSERLYLLGKANYAQHRKTEWWAVEIDPITGSERDRFLLPTEASHLTVVPGKSFWTLVEKDPVEALVFAKGNQSGFARTASLTLVPSRWVRDPGATAAKMGFPRVRAPMCAQLPR